MWKAECVTARPSLQQQGYHIVFHRLYCYCQQVILSGPRYSSRDTTLFFIDYIVIVSKWYCQALVTAAGIPYCFSSNRMLKAANDMARPSLQQQGYHIVFHRLYCYSQQVILSVPRYSSRDTTLFFIEYDVKGSMWYCQALVTAAGIPHVFHRLWCVRQHVILPGPR